MVIILPTIPDVIKPKLSRETVKTFKHLIAFKHVL